MVRKAHRLKLVSMAVWLAFAQSPAGAADRPAVQGFEFAYRIAGAGEIRPIQVFDDGRLTYFQFRSTRNLPAIILAGARPLPMAYAVRGSYVVVRGVHDHYLLRQGNESASVDRAVPASVGDEETAPLPDNDRGNDPGNGQILSDTGASPPPAAVYAPPGDAGGSQANPGATPSAYPQGASYAPAAPQQGAAYGPPAQSSEYPAQSAQYAPPQPFEYPQQQPQPSGYPSQPAQYEPPQPSGYPSQPAYAPQAAYAPSQQPGYAPSPYYPPPQPAYAPQAAYAPRQGGSYAPPAYDAPQFHTGTPYGPAQAVPAEPEDGAQPSDQTSDNVEDRRLRVIQNALNLLASGKISPELASQIIRQTSSVQVRDAGATKTAAVKKAARKRVRYARQPGKLRAAALEVPYEAGPRQITAPLPVNYTGRPIAEYSSGDTREVLPPGLPSLTPAPSRYETGVPPAGEGGPAWRPEWMASRPLVMNRARAMNPDAADAAVQPYLKPRYHFEVAANDRLSAALRRLVEQDHWRLEWLSDKDYNVLYPYSISGDSLDEVLKKALAGYGLKATLYSVNRVIVIRPVGPRSLS